MSTDSKPTTTHPNRDKAECKSTKAVIVVLLIASAAITLIVLIGGWDRLAGAKLIQLGFAVLYVAMAYFVSRWNRGVLPVAAALATLLLIFAAISGPEWFTRDKPGFESALLGESLLGALTIIMVPIQALLIFFALRGFRQEWQVEVEAAPPGQVATGVQ